MARLDGPQKANGFGFQLADGFKFKSAEQLSGSDKEIEVPLSSNASEAEKAKLKQQKEDAKIAEQYKLEQMQLKARKLGFQSNVVSLMDSSFKIDERTKTMTVIIDGRELVYGTDGLKRVTESYKGIGGDDVKCVNEYNDKGVTRIYYKKNEKGKFVKVATTYLDRHDKVKGSEFYDGKNVKTYDSSATDIDVSLIEQR